MNCGQNKIENKENIYKIYIILSFLLLPVMVVLAAHNRISKCNLVLFLLILIFTYGIILCISESFRQNKTRTIKQILLVILPIALFWDSAAFQIYDSNRYGTNALILLEGLIAFNLPILLISTFYINKYNKVHSLERIKSTIYKNIGCIIVCAIYSILFLPSFSLIFKADSEYYYCDIVNHSENWAFSMETFDALRICDHNCFGYTLFAYAGQYLWEKDGIGIRLINLILAITTIIAFNKIINKLFPRLSTFTKTVVTACFAFSPYLLGLSQEISTDFPLLCFFTWFLCAYLYNYKILTYFYALLTTFSKECGSLYILSFFFFAWLYDLLFDCRKHNVKKSICNAANNIKNNIFVCLIILFWAITLFSSNTMWAQTVKDINNTTTVASGTITIRADYILIKLKEILLMNFQWIVTIAVFCALIYGTVKRKIKISKYGFLIVSAYIVFVLFNLFYFTFVHFRYIELNDLFSFIFLAYGLNLFNTNPRVKEVLGFVLASLVTVQSFTSFDPVTNKLFRNIDVGNGSIISTASFRTTPESGNRLLGLRDGADFSDQVFRDYVQYNKDYTGQEIVLEKALEKIDYNDQTVLCIPPIYGDAYTTIVNILEIQDTYYWNRDEKQLQADSNQCKLNFCDAENIDNSIFNSFENVWLIEFPYDKKYNYNNILKKYNIDSTVNVSYGKWTLKLYRISLP